MEEEERNDHSDEEVAMHRDRQEAGVLFGAAYENTYIDIIENED